MRILAIDGGGVRGLIPARVVAELESRLDRQLVDYFDLMVGTSTGAILVAALSLPLRNGRPLPAEELPDVYHRDGGRIFPTGAATTTRERILGRRGMSFADQFKAGAQWVGAPFGGNSRFGGGARHLDDGLEAVLRDTLGSIRLPAALTALRITAYDQISGTPVVFSQADDLEAYDAVRASVAAPTFLPPHDHGGQSLIDGGVWANNPALLALPELLAQPSSLLVSIGTGFRSERIEGGRAHTRNWLQQSASALRFVTERETTDFLLRRAMEERRYFRFQVQLRDDVSMDDPSPANLAALDLAAGRLLQSSSQRFDQLISAIR